KHMPVARPIHQIEQGASSSRFGGFLLALTLVGALVNCGAPPDDPTKPLEVASISIDSPAVQLERGAHKVFTATAKDSKGKVVVVPFVWRTSDEAVASVDLNGRVTARQEGEVGLSASSLGVTSPAVGVRVVFQGAAKLSMLGW